MKTLIRLIAFSTVLPLTSVLAEDRQATDATSTAVSALESSLGNSARGFEVDNVRVTDSGVSCIDYRVRNSQGAESRAHAVVQGDEVLRSTLGNKQFEKAWSTHCLGPRGGSTPAE